MHWRIFLIIYVAKYYRIKLNDFVPHPLPFWLADSPSDKLIFIYAPNRSCFKLCLFPLLPPFSRKLLSAVASDSRFNYIIAKRRREAWLCMYLASDHSKVNCAINWGRGMRGSRNIFFVSHGIKFSSYFEILCNRNRIRDSFSLWLNLVNLHSQSSALWGKVKGKCDVTDAPRRPSIF